MYDEKKLLVEQFKQACKLSGARWMATLGQVATGWEYSQGWGLNKKKRKALAEFSAQSRVARWLDKTHAKGGARYKSTGDHAAALGCERLYLFAEGKDSGRVMVVGADALTSKERNFLRVLAIGALAEDELKLSSLDEGLFTASSEAAGDVTYDPEGGLSRVLESVGSFVASEAAYLAVRSGGIFRVEAVENFPKRAIGHQISLEGNRLVTEMVKTRRGVLSEETAEDGSLSFWPEPEEAGAYWLGVPLVIGKRVIGYLAFRNGRAYLPSDLERAARLARHVAPSIENTMVFVEAARHLQRFALLNELASAASAGIDVDEVTRRVKRMLVRAFSTGQVALLLLSPDRRSLIEYDDAGEPRPPQVYPLEDSLVGYVIESGLPFRVADVEEAPRYFPMHDNVRSKLAVPLRYRGRVIGVLALESSEPDAFSQQDEVFLVVIASQIASLIENARLNAETRQRAHNLALINEIVREVVGLTDLSEIAQLAARLMANRFGFPLVAVMLLDENKDELVVEGSGGADSSGVLNGLRYAKHLGIPGKVLQSGQAVIVDDASREPDYVAIPGWEPGSEMCVPLREAERISGVINVESQTKSAFSENDLLALEALAGVLSSVMMYARRYRQLQTNVRQLEAVRETALDLGTDLDLEVLLERVVSRVRELVDARGAELGLVDEAEKLVRVLVSDNPWQDYTGYTFPLMAGVGGRVAAMGEPLVVADFNVWSGKSDDDFKAPFTTVAGVPLKLAGKTIGTLTVQDDRPQRAFGPEDVQVLELLAPQVSIFIRNARLYQELEDRMEAQRLAESRLVRSAKLAAVGEMAAGVAHELNNPLTTVTGFVELILDELPQDFRQRQDLELVLQEAQRARDVVRRLLDFSRQSEFLRSRADINEVLGDVLALVHHLARTSGVETRVELWNELPVLRIDRGQMQQVFLNLIHNAIQAMPHGGELVIRTWLENRDEGDWIAVSVQDTGVGIKKEHLNHIFEPFFTTKPSGSGTGLGLSISYGIVSDHGGFIDVESQEGEGSDFTVWLPVVPESESVDA